MLKKHLLPLATVMVAAFASNAYAEEAASIPVGGMELIPSLLVGYGYDDNVWGTPGETVSSDFTTFSPKFILRADKGLNVHELSYTLFGEYFNDSHDDDHTDHLFRYDSHLDFNDRNRLDLNAGYTKAKARRDTTNNFFGESGNQTDEYKVGGIYGFGALSGKGQLDLGANYSWLRYNNNYDTGSQTRLRERDVANLLATVYYRVAPKTRALAEVRYENFDYTASDSRLNSDSYGILGGATWDLSAKTAGTVKLGYGKKSFDDNEVSQFDDGKFIWNVAATWLPRTYSTFTLDSRSYYGEGSITEAVIDTINTSLDWKHSWSPYWSTNAKYSYITDDYEGSFNNGRKDKINDIDLGLNYRIARWMDVGAYYRYRDNNSNQSISDWDRNVYGLRANLNL